MPLPRSLPLLLLVGSVAGYSSYASELPNANNVKVDGKSVPGLGHLRDAGGGQNNQFGLDFAAAGRKWTSALCNEDSDGDGRTNGEELGDPDCTWSKGGTPKFDVGITHPGVAENSNSAVVIDTCEGWAVPANIDSVKIELTMPGYQVPTADTTYTKYTFNTAQLLQAAMGPTASPSETFGVRFSPIVEHENVVHHMLLYGCDSKPSGFDSPSTTGRMACANLRYAWAVGAEDFCMPDGVGVRFSSTLADAWHVLEIHYDNPTGLSNVVDNSGVEITLAASKANVLSYQSVGFLWAGAALASVSIPPKRENYHVYTTCSYNNLPEEGVKAFAYITHAHKLGVKLWTELKRDGKYLYDLGCEGNYDFDLQEFKPFAEHVTIYPTDVITANCVYDSMDKTTVTKGGDETNNEMCINFIMYYPEVNGNTKCMKQAIEEKEALAGIHTCCPGATMGANATECKAVTLAPLLAPGWVKVHGILMTLGWGLLLPFGVVASMALRTVLEGGKWFKLHLYIQCLGLFVVTLAAVFAFANLPVHVDSTHKIIGVITMVFAWIQPINGFLRPHVPSAGEAKSGGRVAWEYLHKSLGRLAVILGIVNIITGATYYNQTYGSAVLFYAIFALGMTVVVVSLLYGCVVKRNRVADTK